jgi:peptide/nickel transport system substrate-binding protein
MPRTLTIAYGAEINNLASKLAGGVWASTLNQVTNVGLTVRNPEGVALPRLAAELPSRENGAWVVNPDGTMRTTWRLKPTARWHDGRPVTSQDFAFAFQVTMDDAMPVDNRRPEQFMERVEPVDDHTFTVYWKQIYPWANELGYDELEPLPAHLMRAAYESAPPETFLANPFWTSQDYVAAGPYRIARWDTGAQIVFRAFDDYVLGRPPIDELIFRIIPDPNAVIANLLAGEVQATASIALGQQAGATVKEQWSQSGDGTVLMIPTRYRFLDIQRKPEDLGQPALEDVRVRRALIYGLDRVTIAEVATAGLAPATDVFMPPSDRYYQQAVDAVPKYPYDPTRAVALFAEAGWTRQGDALVNASGQRFVLDIFSSEGSDNEIEQSILAAEWRKLGMHVTETVYPRSRQNDREFRAKFAGVNPTALTIDLPQIMEFGLSDLCPQPPRYTGNNRGCWRNAEFDRLYQVAATSLDAAERANAIIQGQRIVNEDVGKIPLAYRTDAIAYRKGLAGIGTRWPTMGDTWNVHEWRWTQ